LTGSTAELRERLFEGTLDTPPREYPLGSDEPHGDHVFDGHGCDTCMSILELQDAKNRSWDAGHARGFEEGAKFILERTISYARPLLEKHQDNWEVVTPLREMVGHLRCFLSTYTDSEDGLATDPRPLEPTGLVGSCPSGNHVYGECECCRDNPAPESEATGLIGPWTTIGGSTTTSALRE
jgi:hypothetical protein